MAKKVVTQVEFEISQIEQLLESYADLLKRAHQSELNLIEITALASVLHSFYNGLENIFLSIAKGIDNDVPSGSQWHRDLLNQMAQSTSYRESVLTIEIAHQLADYLVLSLIYLDGFDTTVYSSFRPNFEANYHHILWCCSHHGY